MCKTNPVKVEGDIFFPEFTREIFLPFSQILITSFYLLEKVFPSFLIVGNGICFFSIPDKLFSGNHGGVEPPPEFSLR